MASKSAQNRNRGVTVGDGQRNDNEFDDQITSDAEPPKTRPRNHTAATQNGQTIRHQRFVLSDPVAFSYLEEDPSVVILERARQLEGYQCYLVEQWACSRSHPTFLVIAYTGDSSNIIKCGVLSVPADERSWSPRLKVYFRMLAQYHARRRETRLGTILVTNLSGFPSSLTIINIPDGDVRKHREDFVVNENLKRLGCSGRIGISITPPTLAAEAKFHQLYRTSEKVDLYKSVIELVKLCQAALMLFGNLEPEYADGLLCDVTEQAVTDWWQNIGTELYKTEPSDGILGPTTVSALLGTLLGARNRLHAFGAPVSKDVFNIDATKKAIYHFQKQMHLKRKNRLDRSTLRSLHEATAKQASAEGWMVPRAVKSTVAELSGKGGEMVMDMVGRDRGSLAEVETTDIEKFAQLVRGERAKWLWQGKARRRTTRDLFDEHPGQISSRLDDDIGLASPVETAPEDEALVEPKHRQPLPKHARTPTVEVPDQRKAVLKKRFRGATLKKKGHTSKSSQEMLGRHGNESYDSLHSTMSDQLSPVDSAKPAPDNIFDEHAAEVQDSDHSRRKSSRLRDLAPKISHLGGTPRSSSPMLTDLQAEPPPEELDEPIDLNELDRQASRVVQTELSVAADVAQETDWDDLVMDSRPGQGIGLLLQRTLSFSTFETNRLEHANDQRWPRHLSFSAVEDSLRSELNESEALTENPGSGDEGDISPSTEVESPDLTKAPKSTFASEKLLENKQKQVREHLATLGRTAGAWLQTRVHAVSVLDSLALQDTEQIEQIYAPRREEQHVLSEGAQEVLREEKARLTHSMRDLETYGQRLEYEIEGLRGKVEDVEDSIGEFEKQVLYIEDRVNELVKDSEMRDRAQRNDGQVEDVSWSQWLKRVFHGARAQRDVISAMSETIRITKAAAEGAVKDANETNPLNEAPNAMEVSSILESEDAHLG